MRKLYEAADRIEAQMIKDFLESWRIDTVILGDYLPGGAGELPANLTPEVWVVDDRDLALASDLIRELDRGLPPGQSGVGWSCPQCGEQLEGQFAVCWRCATPRPD